MPSTATPWALAPIAPVAREAARLRALVEVARGVGDTLISQRSLAELVARTACSLAGDGATVWLNQSPDGGLRRAAAAHADPRVSAAPAQPLRSDELVGAVLEVGAAAVVGPEEIPTYLTSIDPGLIPWLDDRGVSSAAVLPLRDEGRVLGIVVATRDRQSPAYEESDIAFLQALADVAAATLSTADLLAGSAAAVEDMRRQAELVDQVSDVIISWDVEDRIVSWNSAAERVYLYSAAEALGCDAQALLATEFVGPDGSAVPRDEVATELTETGVWSGDLRQRRADGGQIEVVCSLTGLVDRHGQLTTVIAVNRDVTDQRSKERAALHDSLTGLPNRRFLLDHLRNALRRCASGDGPLAVLFLDLDGFKPVNDTFGHEAGDEVLKVTAHRLAGALRRNDLIARLGGDEFVAVAEQVGGRDNAQDVARRLLAATSKPIEVAGASVRVMPSIGVTVVDAGAAAELGPEESIKAADGAMYVAKRERCGIFTAG